jgi:hypothetical protein
MLRYKAGGWQLPLSAIRRREERYERGKYDAKEQAIAACREIVARSLADE